MPPLSMRRNSNTASPRYDAGICHEYLRPYPAGDDRRRRRGLGLHLSVPVRRETGGAACRQRRPRGAGVAVAALVRRRQEPARAGRRHAEANRGPAKKGEAAATSGAAQTGRARLEQAPLRGDVCGRRRRRLLGHDADGDRPDRGARLRLRGRLRPAVLDAVVSQEAARSRNSSTNFRMRSTSSSAASRPVCRCSTASS